MAYSHFAIDSAKVELVINWSINADPEVIINHHWAEHKKNRLFIAWQQIGHALNRFMAYNMKGSVYNLAFGSYINGILDVTGA